MNVSGIYALTTSNLLTTENLFATDVLYIELKEHVINSSNEEYLYDGENIVVYPGSKITLIPKVINVGADCYIRAKLGFQADNDIFTDYDDYIYDFSENWKKHR